MSEDATTQQDFGQTIVTKQPGLLINTTVPNSTLTGITYDVLDFERSITTINNARSSTAASDILRGKASAEARPAAYGDAFTFGADPAYTAANVSGISWFVVFQSSDTQLINDNNNLQSGNGGTTGGSRWGNQGLIDSEYVDLVTEPADGSGNNWWGTFLSDGREADGGDADTQVNVLNQLRSNVGSEFDNPNEATGPGTTANTTVSTWYIVANSYDPATGTFRSKMTTPDGAGGVTTMVDLTTVDAAIMNPAGIGAGKDHLNMTLGEITNASTNGGNNDWSFDGLMAEVLVYGAALGTNDFDSVVGYLHSKYFTATGAPGDFNDDGKVDAADYVLWRKNSDGNLTVYNAWRENYGVGTGGGSELGGGAVPEPNCAVVVALAIWGMIAAWRTRSFSS